MSLFAFGTGLGLSVVSPWSGSGVSATTFKIGTGLYLIVIAMMASSLGGYIAGRLRSRWIGVHSDEVYFRDTAHGFIAWAFASVLGAVLLATPATSLIGDAVSGAWQALRPRPANPVRWTAMSTRYCGPTLPPPRTPLTRRIPAANGAVVHQQPPQWRRVQARQTGRMSPRWWLHERVSVRLMQKSASTKW